MATLRDGETAEIQGSAKLPYILKNVGGVCSCSCPAWRNQSQPIERRTCKHLRKYLGDTAEDERTQSPPAAKVTSAAPATSATTDEVAPKTPPPLLLAHKLENDANVAGWWMSEKLDGVRAYWDGKQFISRQGNVYHAPAWFTEGLPNVVLDGELWIDRKAFQRTVSIVRRHDASDQWRDVRFVVFDAPNQFGGFESRQKALTETLNEFHPKYASILIQSRCQGVEHLQGELARINSFGGEGLMLRQPESAYEIGRSHTLLKVKTFAEIDAQVIEHVPGKGRHKGRMGALLVKLSNGLEFNVGTGFSDAQREAPPAVGGVINVRYQELTDRGCPRFPSFVRVRSDI